MYNERKNKTRYLGHAVLLTLASLAWCIALIKPAESEQRSFGNVDWILVIDTSKSMRGAAPDAQNVFEAVKEQVKQFIHTANDNDSIAIYTFSEKPDLIRNVLIRNSYDRQDLLDGVQSLRAEGNWTYTGDAVDKALNRAEVVNDKYNDSSREVVIVLFTDDKEDHNPKIPSKYLKDLPIDKIKYRPYAFIVYLNRNNIPRDLNEFVDKYGRDRASIETYSTPAQISGIRDRVVQALKPIVNVSPTSISFGQIEPGDTTESQVVSVYTTRAIALTASLDGNGSNVVSLVEPSGSVVLKDQENHIKLRLRVGSDQPNSDYRGAILLTVAPFPAKEGRNDTSADAQEQNYNHLRVNYNIAIVRVPLFKKVLDWAPYVLGGCFLLYLFAYGKLGGHPLYVIRKRSWLEGQLVVLKPSSDRISNTINLSTENKKSVRLSQLQGGMLKKYLEDADAELKTVRRNGIKLVNIKRVAGEVLLVQEAEVTSADLKDGEVIEIGDLELRYRGYQPRFAQAQLEG
jgi:hypothetical protein